MKKLTISLLLLMTSFFTVKAQNWITGPSPFNANVYYPSTGKVTIGNSTWYPASLAINPSAQAWNNISTSLIVGKTDATLSTAVGSYSYISEYQGLTPNVNRLQTTLFRRRASSDWTGTAYRIRFAVDHTFTDGLKAYMEIGASDPTNFVGGGFISFGTEGVDRLSITSNGNVGIGTIDTHGAKLAVAGPAGILAEKMVVKAFANWPDYVFAPSYKLPSLQEVEHFITFNQHLPEVPSAAEINKDGIDLGANQAALLKKIEELTLYLIEMNKKIEQLQKQNEKEALLK